MVKGCKHDRDGGEKTVGKERKKWKEREERKIEEEEAK